jgi:TM2 domain-containing membrane protein YozV
MRTVTIIRQGKFSGSALDVDIYVDGIEYAVLRNGDIKTFEIEDGSHRIQAKSRESSTKGFFASLAGGYVDAKAIANKSDVLVIGENEGDVTFLINTTGGTHAGGVLQLVRTTMPISNSPDGATNNVDGAASAMNNALPNVSSGKSHMVAGILAILLGSLGIHKFYLGYTVAGIIMLLATIFGGIISGGIIVAATGIIGIIEGILYLTKQQSDFDQRYVFNKRSWF